MNTQFVWKEEYNIGVELIDKEHQELFQYINRLFQLTQKKWGWNNSRQSCRKGIEFFKKHAVEHFADEEAYMISIGYKGVEQHRRIHEGFLKNTLPALEQELKQTDYSPEAVEHFLGVCAGWLIGHTTMDDLSITGKNDRKWEHLLPGEEQAALRKAIAQLMYDMFLLRPQMVSDSYRGEKFGKGIYYRMLFGSEQSDKKKEIFLVFEEKLLFCTVGRKMGANPARLSNSLLHAARLTMQRFTKRIQEFLAEEYSKLEEENFLPYEDFQEALENEKLLASLLFNSGEGYFAYCVLDSHSPQKDLGTPIDAQNATAEVEKYLNKREEQEKAAPKRKILLVDDSLMIRQGMEKLLGKDYEIFQAESGVAALNILRINRPDLVLLDYDMPICNGKQTLELIRSQKDFLDIPVIFLTGRDDAETVNNVLALKPTGYMLKSLKQSDIKNRIDAFFEKKN
ncbi:response regulator [Clostridiaceae bacterium]|nr:response regulator [Clostridiaceae bacterium]RKI13775.1 response regulator [bacterium 1XD21-70]